MTRPPFMKWIERWSLLSYRERASLETECQMKRLEPWFLAIFFARPFSDASHRIRRLYKGFHRVDIYRFCAHRPCFMMDDELAYTACLHHASPPICAGMPRPISSAIYFPPTGHRWRHDDAMMPFHTPCIITFFWYLLFYFFVISPGAKFILRVLLRHFIRIVITHYFHLHIY